MIQPFNQHFSAAADTIILTTAIETPTPGLTVSLPNKDIFQSTFLLNDTRTNIQRFNSLTREINQLNTQIEEVQRSRTRFEQKFTHNPRCILAMRMGGIALILAGVGGLFGTNLLIKKFAHQNYINNKIDAMLNAIWKFFERTLLIIPTFLIALIIIPTVTLSPLLLCPMLALAGIVTGLYFTIFPKHFLSLFAPNPQALIEQRTSKEAMLQMRQNFIANLTVEQFDEEIRKVDQYTRLVEDQAAERPSKTTLLEELDKHRVALDEVRAILQQPCTSG